MKILNSEGEEVKNSLKKYNAKAYSCWPKVRLNAEQSGITRSCSKVDSLLSVDDNVSPSFGTSRARLRYGNVADTS